MDNRVLISEKGIMNWSNFGRLNGRGLEDQQSF